jgi:putative ABC transport system substrate-binding protein
MMKRRSFITLLGGAAAAWPLPARAQRPQVPVVAYVSLAAPDPASRTLAAFRKGLSETAHVEGHSVTVEYHWLEGRYDLLPELMAGLSRRHIAVIVAPGNTATAIAAKAATATIPIVFGVSDDPVKFGLVTSLARPGGNATGVNFFQTEINAKRFGLLHQLVPKAERIALLLNPENTQVAEGTLQEVRNGARSLGLQIRVLNASSSDEIDAAFAALARGEDGAVFVVADQFYYGRRVQFATLATRDRVPASFFTREFVEVGGLMSYGTSLPDAFRQIGAYTGSILKGAKPADLPVVQSTKFELVINLQTTRLLRIEVPPMLLAIADEVIE